MLGYRLNPFYVRPKNTSLPAEVDLTVFWLIQLNARKKREQTVMLPIVIDVPFGDPHLRLFLPRGVGGTAELFPTLHEGIMAAAQFDNDFAKPAGTISFFRDAMRRRSSSRSTLLMLPEQYLRRVFTELNDQRGQITLNNILRDQENVRVARRRFSNDNEAPFCIPSGIRSRYQGPQAVDLFYSILTVNPDRPASGNWHKLDWLENSAVNPSTVQIWMSNLQSGDNPADWATLVHRLRRGSSHTDIPTVYPQPLHDALSITEYLSRCVVESANDDDLNALAEKGIDDE